MEELLLDKTPIAFNKHISSIKEAFCAPLIYKILKDNYKCSILLLFNLNSTTHIFLPKDDKIINIHDFNRILSRKEKTTLFEIMKEQISIPRD